VIDLYQIEVFYGQGLIVHCSSPGLTVLFAVPLVTPQMELEPATDFRILDRPRSLPPPWRIGHIHFAVSGRSGCDIDGEQKQELRAAVVNL
jgi:hypothetical protein